MRMLSVDGLKGAHLTLVSKRSWLYAFVFCVQLNAFSRFARMYINGTMKGAVLFLTGVIGLMVVLTIIDRVYFAARSSLL